VLKSKKKKWLSFRLLCSSSI